MLDLGVLGGVGKRWARVQFGCSIGFSAGLSQFQSPDGSSCFLILRNGRRSRVGAAVPLVFFTEGPLEGKKA